ncbi:hypothetical protein D3218_08390 [Aureimonas flava]|uniref:Sulfatase N-terminal domain-containing protein n=1 Tax=Aureimonas flava TaxID=2320271 RepID=A0A3A1WJP3_9HYPH|nr:hypothetical protein [Aureimonas flava]RIY01370.1 hypothetical protein D3218_08390 [Aureimonas flava]
MSDRVLFITLDSCRYDTFVAAEASNIKAVAPFHKARSPSYFTYGSHSAMFVGFTPGIPGAAEPLLDPKFGKLFKLTGPGFAGKGTEGYTLQGDDIMEGFRRLGYRTIGAAAMGWFDPATETGRHLIKNFDRFAFPGPYHLREQLAFIDSELSSAEHEGLPTFTFLNVGETHVPYWHEGASWRADDNPCLPFQTVDRSADCRARQRACLEYVDRMIAPLLHRHLRGTILICGDHGDCWGEDGLWEHGIAHPMTTTVPLLIRHQGKPVARRKSSVPEGLLRRLLGGFRRGEHA